MRSADSGTVSALTQAATRGIVPRKFFWATGKDWDTGEPVPVGFWGGDYTVTVEVLNGATGALEERVYVGGVNLSVGPIPRVSTLTIQTVEVSLSAIAPPVQNFVRGADIRRAAVEIHLALLAPESRLPVARPEIECLGEIDGSPIDTASAGGESLVKLPIRSDAMLMLARKNHQLRSHEGQKRRSGDEWGRYSNVVGTWQVSWGEKVQA